VATLSWSSEQAEISLIPCRAYKSSGEPPFPPLVASMLLIASCAGTLWNKMYKLSPHSWLQLSCTAIPCSTLSPLCSIGIRNGKTVRNRRSSSSRRSHLTSVLFIVLITADGTVRLADLGLGRAFVGRDRTTKSQVGVRTTQSPFTPKPVPADILGLL
jgi:hypothetical protein